MVQVRQEYMAVLCVDPQAMMCGLICAATSSIADNNGDSSSVEIEARQVSNELSVFTDSNLSESDDEQNAPIRPAKRDRNAVVSASHSRRMLVPANRSQTSNHGSQSGLFPIYSVHHSCACVQTVKTLQLAVTQSNPFC